MSQSDVFCIKSENICIKNEKICIKNEKLCIKNEELCIKNEEFCIQNDEFVRFLTGLIESFFVARGTSRLSIRCDFEFKNDGLCIKMTDFVLKMMGFVFKMVRRQCTLVSTVGVFCIYNEEMCIINEELCIKSDEFCRSEWRSVWLCSVPQPMAGGRSDVALQSQPSVQQQRLLSQCPGDWR